MTTLAFDDARHLSAHRWLVDEAYLLDEQRYDEWLALMAHDIRYVMPVRTTLPLGQSRSGPEMAHLDEDRYSLGRRVARFATGHAWTEDPPSRLRHHVSNVRCRALAVDDLLAVDSAVLLFRSRGDVNAPSWLSYGRHDILRRNDESWTLTRRTIDVNESVLRTQNLAMFL